MYGITLIGVLVILGGVIAYIGDKIGMTVGKKRLTLFGLRPKHTSILVTIITGIVISTLSLTVLTLASQDVRTALFGMEELKTQLVSLARAVDEKDEELEDVQDKYDGLTREIAAKEDRLVDLQHELEELVAERQEYMERLEGKRGELDEARTAIESLSETRDELESRVEELTAQRGELQKQITELTQAKEYYEESLVRVRTEDIIFQPREELASVVIRGGEDERIRSGMRELMEDAMQHSLMRGARPETDGGSPIRLREYELKQTNDILETLDGQEIIVRLVATSNTVRGEPVNVRFELHENKLVFSEGEAIASVTIDGSKSSSEIQNILLSELLLDVNHKAQDRGMLHKSIGGEVGELSPTDFFDIVEEILDREGPVEVTAYAAHDAWTKPPLNIELIISDV